MKYNESPRIDTQLHRRTAYSYVRFSSPEQAKGDSYRRQIEKARDYARRKNLDLDESFVDRGLSGFKGANRSSESALGRFVARVENDDVPADSVLIVESLDRLSREKVAEAMEFFLSLTRKGLSVVTLADNEKEYSRATMNEDQFQLLGSLIVMIRAHEESALKSERVSKAWKNKKKRALEDKQAMTSRCPGWLRLVNGPRSGHYEVIEERASMILGWFADTIAGIGRRTIAKGLNEQGIPCWGIGQSVGDRWHDSYIGKVIASPAVCGTYVSTDESGLRTEIKGYFPAIITEETFWKAQAASAARGSGKGPVGKTHRNMLRGLAKCEFCGSNMVILDKGARSKGPKLKCGKAHQSAGCDHRTLYAYKPIEIGVIHGLGDKATELSMAAVESAKAATEKKKAASLRLAEKENELKRMLDLFQSTGKVPQVFERVRLLGEEAAALKNDLAEINRKLSVAVAADPASDVVDVGTIYGQLARLSGNEKVKARAEIREKLTHLLDKVVVGPNGFISHHKDGGRSITIGVGKLASSA